MNRRIFTKGLDEMGIDEAPALRPEPIQLQELQQHMPPGINPISDGFDVITMIETFKKAEVETPYIVTFSLKAAYERIRDLEGAALHEVGIQEQFRYELEDLKSKANVVLDLGEQGSVRSQITSIDSLMERRTGMPKEIVVTYMKSSPRWPGETEMRGNYVLVRDNIGGGMVDGWPNDFRIALEELSRMTCYPCKNTQGVVDPTLVVEGIRRSFIDNETLGIDIRKLCGVEESSETTTEEAVQQLAEHATQLSLGNVRLRNELEEARGKGFIHPRRYVENLESTPLGIGRLLGHKTFPTMDHPTPYQHQMHTYCSRLLQAVRTRMLNQKGSK